MAHTCYFSKRCRFCQAFFEELSSTPYVKEIQFICVDPSPSRPPLPAWLKSVPSLIVQGEYEPRVGPAAVNNWLFERRLLGNGGGSKPTNQTIPSYATPPIPKKSNTLPEPISSSTAATSTQGPPALAGGGEAGGPEAWHGAEMAGGHWSDNYSFVSDSFTSEKGLNPIVRNFELLQSAGPQRGGAAGGAAGGGGGPARTAKEEKLIKEFEQFSKMRDMEFAGPKRM
jgi:hypothetical protein